MNWTTVRKFASSVDPVVEKWYSGYPTTLQEKLTEVHKKLEDGRKQYEEDIIRKDQAMEDAAGTYLQSQFKNVH